MKLSVSCVFFVRSFSWNLSATPKFSNLLRLFIKMIDILLKFKSLLYLYLVSLFNPSLFICIFFFSWLFSPEIRFFISIFKKTSLLC